MWHLLFPVYGADLRVTDDQHTVDGDNAFTHLIDALEVRTQPSVHAEHPAVDDGAQRQVVEHLAAPPPHVAAAILALALVVEAVHLCDLP